MLTMTIQKLFELHNSLSSKAETKPPKGMSEDAIRWSIATKVFTCLLCNIKVDKTYHIHPTTNKHSSKKKYAIRG